MAADKKMLVNSGAHGAASFKTTQAQRAALDQAYAKSHADFLAASDGEKWLEQRYREAGLDYEATRKAMKKHAVFPAQLQGIGLQDRYRRIADAFEQRDAQAMMDAMTGGVTDRAGAIEARKTFDQGSLGELSDLIGSATRNKVCGLNASGCGHENSYYKRADYLAGTECFANLFCLLGGGGLFFKQVVERLTPEMNKLFLDLLK